MSTGELLRGHIRLRGVSRRFRIVHDRSATLKETLIRRSRVEYSELWALRDVDLDIHPGDAVAFIGRNGAGKSTLLKVIAGILPPQAGTVETAGSVAAMLELGSGFHPDFTGRENVYMNGAIHGLRTRDVAARLPAIIDFAELADFIDMPVRTYSSGMQMRLSFAVAAHVNPDILLLDEVLTVGDAAFQEKCMRSIYSFLDHGGTLAFVSHSADAVSKVCNRAILIDGGCVLLDGAPDEVLSTYEDYVAEGAGLGADLHMSRPLSATDAAPATLPSAQVLDLVVVQPDDPALQSALPPGAQVSVRARIRNNTRAPGCDVEVVVTNALQETVLLLRAHESGVTVPSSPGEYDVCATFQLPVQESALNVSAVIRDRTTEAPVDQWNGVVPLQMKREWPGAGVVASPASWAVTTT